jgi:hypothetical protein
VIDELENVRGRLGADLEERAVVHAGTYGPRHPFLRGVGIDKISVADPDPHLFFGSGSSQCF